jgi:hypothetical protein
MRLASDRRCDLWWIVSVALCGCAGAAVNLVSYQSAVLAQADVIPTREQLSTTRVKVVVLPADATSVGAVNGEAHAGEVMRRALEHDVSEGQTEIVDRTLSEKLSSEIELAIFKQKGTSGGPEVAQYAVKGIVGNASFKRDFTAAETSVDKGKSTTTAAHCDYKVEVTSSLRIYELPGLRLVSTVPAPGSATKRTEMPSCDNSQDAALLQQAVEKGVHKARHQLKNVFAPKGYVTEKRVSDGKPPIFRVSFGAAQGAASENKLKFYTIRKSQNALTREATYDEIQLGEGKVSDQVSDGFCWVVADKDDTAKAIRAGDFVKIFHEKSMLEKLDIF